MGTEMTEKKSSDMYHAFWHGRRIAFKRLWRGYRFSDDECRRLVQDEVLEVRGLKSIKSGEIYGVKCQLADCISPSGDPYVGVDIVSYLKRGIPKEWRGHKFTEDEMLMLEAGQFVAVDDFVSVKTGKPFACRIRYDAEQDMMVYDFNK